MPEFRPFKEVVEKRFNLLQQEDNLFVVDIPKDILWETYLKAFPEGTNPIFRERTEHDCSCCRYFIKNAGGVVAIGNGYELRSMWDVEAPYPYDVVAKAMRELVENAAIDRKFYHFEPRIGVDYNLEADGAKTYRWEHFHQSLVTRFVCSKDRRAKQIGDAYDDFQVFSRTMELDPAAFETVNDLIGQNSLYRGEQFADQVRKMAYIRNCYSYVEPHQRENFCWKTSAKLQGASRLRNNSIGTLLVDLSDGVPLETAVKSYEQKVAPANYKRPTSLITKTMIDNAQKKIEELGLKEALQRRFAVPRDITVNNLIYVNRDSKGDVDIFDSLRAETPVKDKEIKNATPVDIEDFIKNVVPKAGSIDALFENRMTTNLVSLIAPVNEEAGSLFPWSNNFSWSYNGNFTDSIKEKVKAAGGKVEGVLRCSLAWYNYDDLDIHVQVPRGNTIYFGNSEDSVTGGKLDVDMNAGGKQSDTPVENIIWSNLNRMQEGKYIVTVNNYTKRETRNPGFEVEIEFNGQITTFAYAKAVADGETVNVAAVEYSKKDGFKIIEGLPGSAAMKTVWSITTNHFQPVSMIMNSPNHWDNNKSGNRHWFFMLSDCLNDEPARGLFNEFLLPELNEHRKVFEVLGNKMKTPLSDDQLSGLGFSSTKRDSLICRVQKGGKTELYEVKF